MDTQWPLVGRAVEQRRVEELLREGKAGGLIIFGPAGAGKTRLALHANDFAIEHGYRSLNVSATHASQELPLGAFAPWLSPEASATAEPHFVLAGAAASLKGSAGKKRLLLCIDDMHYLDNASSLLVHQMISHHDVVVVATCRDDAASKPNVFTLWKEGLLERVDLRSFNEEESAQLASVIAGGPIDSITASELHRLSNGLPLTLRELIFASERRNVLTFENGVWSLSGEIATESRLGDLFKGQIKENSPAEVALLQTVAVGEPVILRHLLQIHDISLLEELESRSILAIRKEGAEEEVRFVHPLYSEILRNSLPSLQRRRRIRELADLYREDSGSRSDVALRVALWSIELGENASPTVLMDAAMIAFATLDLKKARHLAEAAWEIAPTAETATFLGTVLWMTADYKAASEVLAAAWSTLRGPREMAIVGLARSTALEGLEKFQEAEDILTQAAAAQNDTDTAGDKTLPDVNYSGLLQVRRAKFLLHLNRKSEAESLLSFYKDSPDPYVRWEACITLGLLLAHDGRPEEAARTVDALNSPESRRHSHIFLSHHPIMKGLAQAIALMQSGAVADALTLLREAENSDTYRDSPSGRAMLEGVRAEAELLRGDARQAADRLTRVLASRVEQGWPLGRTYLQCCLLQAGSLVGDAQAMARARAGIGAGGDSLAYAVGAHGVAEAWAAVADGNIALGQQLLIGVAEKTEGRRETIRLEAAHSLARLGDPKTAARHIQDVPPPEGPLLSARVQYIKALARSDASTLETAGEEFEKCGARLLAAEAHADASRIYTRQGDKRAAAKAMRTATRLFDQCPGVRTPISISMGSAAQLTGRERQIALLAARNMSSAEVAEQLVVSIRTVDNHLQKIFSKLGITSRREIRKALRLSPDDESTGAPTTR
ncbi:LuxR C-terminal-related transcriptional regulator [Streptomyces sp. NPDC005244]|uniref:LuxR C-terminal-related transcriptional regulator n=1 Tax=Streptomyces sp. NPDC005244 TaxID=3364708 RepID=UPI0036936393